MKAEDVLSRLASLIAERKRLRPEGSYVVSLFDGGHEAIAAKVSEEAAELIEAAGEDDLEHTAHEAADLLFHVCVLLENSGVSLDQVTSELESRFGISGLEEKASRTPSNKNSDANETTSENTKDKGNA
ncbi:MAG: phosphoribosyl-ATP pyrophosphohydrolase [Myxococcota bacterium]|jgi:phosphoribosyl-ATP pyrophosphohydrolase